MLINFLDKIALGLVAVPMMDELHLTPKQFGDIGSGFFWLFAIGGVFGGFLANTATVYIVSYVLTNVGGVTEGKAVLVGKLLAIGASFAVNFSLSHFVVFRKKAEG